MTSRRRGLAGGIAAAFLCSLLQGARAECVVSRHSGEARGDCERLVPVPAGLASMLALVRSDPSGDVSVARAAQVAEAARLAVLGQDAPTTRRPTAGPGLAAGGDGWRGVRVDPDRVLVEGGAPAGPPRPEDARVEVQTFALTGAAAVTLRCPGRAFRLGEGAPVPLGDGREQLDVALGRGTLLCTGGAFRVAVAGSPERVYAGTFHWSPPPARAPQAGESRRESRARRGSDVVFTTTLGAYVAGVLRAEDASLAGEPRVALARVVAHDARVERHPGRPPCDTTHCQAFLGTARPVDDVRRALSAPPLPAAGWLPYARGGRAPWRVTRDPGEVAARLGPVTELTGDGATVRLVRPDGTTEVRSCEAVRAALRLPGCPLTLSRDGGRMTLAGEGAGHGLGLDVEVAKRSGLPSRVLLERAYGFPLDE